MHTYMGMQPGDMPAARADASILHRLTGYRSQTDIRDEVQDFVNQFREYYRV